MANAKKEFLLIANQGVANFLKLMSRGLFIFFNSYILVLRSCSTPLEKNC
jgi:hypothetical protein